MNENNEYEQLLFPSIDQSIDACLDAIHFLEKNKSSEQSIACITLCRDCSELSTMLTVLIIRKSLFAPRIAQVLLDICYELHDKLKELGNSSPEIFNCIKTCTMCAEKIQKYLKNTKADTETKKNKQLKKHKQWT